MYGLKFLTNAGSPEPVMTRQVWDALAELEARVAAGTAAVTISAAIVAVSPAAAAIAGSRRMERT